MASLALSGLSLDQLRSLDSMDGLPDCSPSAHCRSLPQLLQQLHCLYQQSRDWDCIKARLHSLLDNLHLSDSEFTRYCHCSQELPYTRNLVHTDNKHYTLLILCWTPGYESKIHNHPCDGCFVKVLKGSIEEHKYHLSSDGEVTLDKVIHAPAGTTTYMDDSLGLHKIGNSSPATTAVTLHLYTPPYTTSKVWLGEGCAPPTMGKMFHFSEYGNRCSLPTESELAYYI
jgi:cysteine dioxygenase